MKRIKMGKYLFNNVIKIKISLYFKLKSCSFFETFLEFSCNKKWENIYFKILCFFCAWNILDLGTRPTIYGEPK